jgi:uncharacterized protein
VKTAIALAAAFLLGPVCALAAQEPAVANPGATSATPSDPAPTEDSIRQLLLILEARKLVDAMPGQMKAVTSGMVQQMLQGQTLSSEQQQRLDTMLANIEKLMREQLSWDSLEATYIEVYQKTFTQSEVDGMIAFYSSPTGQAVVRKMPLAMQNSMTAVQQRIMTGLLPKIQQMAQDAAKEIQAQSGTKKSG